MKWLYEVLFFSILSLLTETISGQQFGNACNFYSTSSYIEIPDDSVLRPPAFTLETWIKVNAFSSQKIGGNTYLQYIVFKQAPRAANFEGFALTVDEAAHKITGWISSEVSNQKAVASNSIQLNKWYHIALTANSSYIKLYVDGTLTDSRSTGFPLYYDVKPLYIGRSNETRWDGFFNGSIDEVRLWNYVKNQTEINALKNQELNGDELGLIAYYNMNLSGQGQGIQVTNGSSFGNKLTGVTFGTATSPFFGISNIILSGPDIETGLVGYWPLNGNAVDHSGYGNNGTVNGATPTTDRFNNESSAYSFNGIDSYIDILSAPELNVTQAITLSCWIKYNHVASCYEDVFMKGATSYGFQFSCDGKSTLEFHLTSNGWRNINSGVKPRAGLWYNIVGTYDGKVQKVYINGALKDSVQWTGPIQLNNDPLSIGYKVAEDNAFYKGTVDDIRVYNRSLSLQDVLFLYNSSKPSHLVTYTSPAYAIKTNSSQAIVAEPIQLGTGTYSFSQMDVKISALGKDLNFARYYNSLNGSSTGPFGYGWSHSYNFFVENQQDTIWNVHYPDGHVTPFVPLNDGLSLPLYSGTTDSLQKDINDTYSLFTKEKLQYHFNETGRLDSIIDLNGNVTRLHYNSGNLDSVLAPGGRYLAFQYAGGKIAFINDPLHRTWNYSYDGNGNLIAVQDANGGSATFTYNASHRMLTAATPLGNLLASNVYDSAGKVISQKDAYNNMTTIAYNYPGVGDAAVTNPDNSQMIVHHDSYIRKTSEKNELGFTRTYGYDANSNETIFTNENSKTGTRLFDQNGNLLADTLPGNKITTITYNAFNSPLLVTDAKGAQKRFYYNLVNNNLDSVRFADNTLQKFFYNSQGLVIQSVDGNGHLTAFTYSPAGDLLTVKTVAGIKQFAYDSAGRKIAETDENSHTTTYHYDNNDNILKVTDALGRTIESTYDADDQLLTLKDRKGFVTTFTYDKKGRKTATKDAKGGITAYTYDVRDNLTSVTDPNGHTISYTYDKAKRKTGVTNALGTTQYQYDGVGNLMKVIDPTGKSMEYSYTATNKKQTQKDGLGNTTTYEYDLNNNLTAIKDALNRTTTYGYDALNRLVSVKDAMNKTTIVTYDDNSNRETVTDPNGHTQTYSYDAVNRLISYQDAAGNTYAYSYDSVGNNTLLTKPTGTISKVFDAANRVVAVTNSSGVNYLFTHDKNDNVLTMSNSAGTSTMTYDSLNRLVQHQDPYSKTVSFNYDPVGNRTAVIYPGNKTVVYAYGNANNLTMVTDWLSHSFTYSYDAAGRVTELLYPNGVHVKYAFDNAGRLVSKKDSLGTGAILSGSTFTMDAVGNRTAEQRMAQVPSGLPFASNAYSYDSDDRMLTDSIWNYTHDGAGNRTAETDGVKTAGYTFSVDNLLNSRVDTSGTTTSYAYDAAGHRISKTVGANSIRFVLDISSSLSQVLQITDDGGAIKTNYIYGLGLLESVDAAGNPLYYHFDAQHNTTAITNQNAVIQDRYTYDPFGAMLSHSGESIQPFTFLGEYGVEQESPALYYARARYYDAPNGRFISKDAHDYNLNNTQTINRYVYGINNPSNNYDPSGLFSIGMFSASVAQFAKGGTEVVSSYISGRIAALAASTGLEIPAGIIGVIALNEANDAFKDFNAGAYNIKNSFTQGNTIADAKFAEDPDISGIPYVDDFLKHDIVQDTVDDWTKANALFSIGDLLFSGDISNISTASKYINDLPRLSKAAINGSRLNIISDLIDIYKGLKSYNNSFNSKCSSK